MPGIYLKSCINNVKLVEWVLNKKLVQGPTVIVTPKKTDSAYSFPSLALASKAEAVCLEFANCDYVIWHAFLEFEWVIN